MGRVILDAKRMYMECLTRALAYYRKMDNKLMVVVLVDETLRIYNERRKCA